MYKVMLDSNAFDCIYDKGLIDKLTRAINTSKLSIYVTTVQSQELDRIRDPTKKEAIKSIPKQFVTPAISVYGDDKSNRGFRGDTYDGGAVYDSGEEIHPERLAKPTPTHPIGDMGDIEILYTAAKEGFDYVVSNNTKDFADRLNVFQAEHIGLSLKLINCDTFIGLLNSM